MGNYYVAEPLFRELKRVFPDHEIRTTFQMSDEFCERFGVVRLPMELYYGWREDDLSVALNEFAWSKNCGHADGQSKITDFMQEVLDSDLVVDFSGDIWGDNANFVGPNRFLVGLLKNRTAQLLGRPTAMIAGSPGPFDDATTRHFAREVFSSFDLVTNREAISIDVLSEHGFDVSNVESYACPAFLYSGVSDEELASALIRENLNIDRPKIGFALCGWNMPTGPYTKWPRRDEEFSSFTKLVDRILDETDADVYFLSHSNGFVLPPNFKPIHGRDYPFAEHLHAIMQKAGNSGRVHLIREIYGPAQMKGILRHFDMLISGRVHAAVGALAQSVPTVIIDYGHEPKAHKLKGFAQVAGIEEFFVDPADPENMAEVTLGLWKQRGLVSKQLDERIPQVQKMSRANFDSLRKLVS